MNYRLIRSSIKVKSRFGGFRIALAFFALVLLVAFFQPRLPGAIGAAAAAPFWRGGAWVAASVENVLGFLTSRQALLNEVAALRAELAAREGERQERAALLEENAAMKKEMGKNTDTAAVLVATILAMSPRSPYDTVALDVGARDRVAVDDEVFSESVLVGRVSEVHDKTSIASLFSSPGTRVSVTLVHNGVGTSVEAEGQGGSGFIARLPREVPIATGDEVHLSDRPLTPFAVVAAMTGSESEPFRTIFITSFAPINGLRFLSVHHL